MRYWAIWKSNVPPSHTLSSRFFIWKILIKFELFYVEIHFKIPCLWQLLHLLIKTAWEPTNSKLLQVVNLKQFVQTKIISYNKSLLILIQVSKNLLPIPLISVVVLLEGLNLVAGSTRTSSYHPTSDVCCDHRSYVTINLLSIYIIIIPSL